MDARSWFVSLALLAVLPAAALADTDPRGPINNPGIRPVVDAEGVHSPGFTFDPKTCAKPSPWQGKWIWPPAVPRDAAAAAFRKEITLAEAPRHVAAWLSADTKYRLYINGRLAARGPVDQGRDYEGGSTERWFYDCRDLTQFFVKGKNAISLEVFQRWPVDSTVSRGRPGLIFEVQFSLSDGTMRTIASDTTWKAARADWFTAESGLSYYAGREPPGWRMAGFDDSAWKSCEVVKDIWSPLIPGEIPPLMEARYPVLRIENVRGGANVLADAAPGQARKCDVHNTSGGITVTADGSFTVVFDRVLSAYPTLKLNGGKGARVTIRAHRQSQMVLGGGEQYYEWPFMDEIAPAFTVSFANVTEPIVVEDVGANFTSQPVDYVGSFECSDEKLNKIWKVSRWAVQICMQTHHLDSPNHQEPICDPGDYVIEAMVSYYAFGQPWLARQDIRKFAWVLQNEKYRNFHTSYSLYWLQMLEDYTSYTGDQGLENELRPFVYGLADTYARWVGKNGLVCEAPNYMFMDWVSIGGFNCHHPPAVIGQGYLTALYKRELADVALNMALRDNVSRVGKYGRAIEQCQSSFNRELWSESKGLYRDGKPFQTSVRPGRWLPADKEIETFSPHVNLLAVLADLAPEAKQKAIVEKIMSQRPLNTQPWFMHTVFAAIDHAGLFNQYGAQQLRRWMIVPETQSFREMWQGGDLSHGWCSTPLVQMSQRILGVQVLGRTKSLWIEPRFCDLAWAKGSVPSPCGLAHVSWKADARQITIDLANPCKAEATVCLPAGGIVTVDGRKQEPELHLDSALYMIPLGTHHIELQREKSRHEE